MVGIPTAVRVPYFFLDDSSISALTAVRSSRDGVYHAFHLTREGECRGEGATAGARSLDAGGTQGETELELDFLSLQFPETHKVGTFTRGKKGGGLGREERHHAQRIYLWVGRSTGVHTRQNVGVSQHVCCLRDHHATMGNRVRFFIFLPQLNKPPWPR